MGPKPKGEPVEAFPVVRVSLGLPTGPPGMARVKLRGSDVEVFSPFVATLDDPARPVVAHVAVRIDDDGEPRVLWVTVEPRGEHTLTLDDLRVPIESIVRAALPGTMPSAPGPSATASQQVRTAAAPRRQRRRLTDENMREVLAVVGEAEAAGTSIRRAVMERFDLGSLNTARNWIAKAREAERKRTR